MPISRNKILSIGERLLQEPFLNEREKEILKFRLGLSGETPRTLEDIGQIYNITRERARQIGESIIKKARKNLPEYRLYAGKLFSKSWKPKYYDRFIRVKKRKAVSQRKRSIIKNRSKKLEVLYEEFLKTGEKKEEIVKLLKYLRIKYRKKQFLFDPEMTEYFKKLRARWKEIRHLKPTPPEVQGQIS